MQDIASFSDLLSQLSPFARLPLGGAPEQASADVPEPAAARPAEQPEILSNLPGTTFDSTGAPPADLAGVYRPPTTAVQYRMGAALDFQLDLSMARQTTVLSEPSSADLDGGFAAAAREQTSLSYQSLQALYRNSAGGTFREVRAFQAQMFRSQTRQISARLDPETGDRLDRTAQTVSRTFQIDIKLEVSFLSQFVRQSDQISGMEDGLFQQYLEGTDRSAGISGEAAQAFFDQVDGFLADTQAFVEEALSSFFQDVAASFGLSEQEVGALQDLVTEEVSALFSDMDRFLDDARALMAGPQAEPALPKPEPAQAPAQAESNPEVA
jgi:hypothetical protein